MFTLDDCRLVRVSVVPAVLTAKVASFASPSGAVMS
jgi:hypothetical protein